MSDIPLMTSPHLFAEVYNLHWVIMYTKHSSTEMETMSTIVESCGKLRGGNLQDAVVAMSAMIRAFPASTKWNRYMLHPIEMLFSSLTDWCILNGDPVDQWWFSNWNFLYEGIVILTASYEAADKSTPTHIDYIGKKMVRLHPDYKKYLTIHGIGWHKASVSSSTQSPAAIRPLEKNSPIPSERVDS